MSEKTKHIGAPPGTIFYTGEDRSDRVKITLIEYNETDYHEKEYFDLSDCLLDVKPNMTKWINIDGIHNTQVIEKIGQLYNIHALTLEDIAHVDQRPKFEDYDHYVLAIMKMLSYNTEVISEQLSIILLDNTVISFQELPDGDVFDIIRNRIRNSKGKIRKSGADYLCYALMDTVVDYYFYCIEKIGDKIEVIEEEIINDSNKKSLIELYNLKREMIFLRKQVWPMRDMISNLSRSQNKLIKDSNDIYYRDLNDHVIRIIDTVETYRDLLAGIMDIYLSTNSNKMNEVMKVLTIMSSIFIPVTFVVGVYGMNFEYMPELKTQNGYYIVWGIMIAIMLGLLFYFKRKKWM